MNDARPIGVFDSGMGGLTVLRALRDRMPNENLVYLGDTARLPYGTKSPETVTSYALQATRLLMAHDVKMVVIACNTASSVALGPLSDNLSPLGVIGVVEPGASAGVAASTSGRIGVLATEGTVEGGAYLRAIAALSPDAHVQQQACAVFVALAEEGWNDGDIAEAAVKRYLAPLFADPTIAPDTLVLGCTHFPVLASVITKVLPTFTGGATITLVDSAATTADTVATALVSQSLCNDENNVGTEKFLATDAPERFARVGGLFFGSEINADQVELVDLLPSV